jgi:glycosyltransferase involved in cell wall biosynthesis
MRDTAGNPKVSVVMPAYNHAPYVARGIRSVLEQTYDNIQLVVVDDGSTDGTWKEIERAQREARRPFLAIKQENRGICGALNRGIAATDGEFIAAIASDDYFLPRKIERQVAVFRSSTESVALVHTSAYLDYQDGCDLEDLTGSYSPAEGQCFDRVIAQEVRVIAPSMVFRRSAYVAIGGFDDGLAADDVDFFIRLSGAGYEFAYVPEPLLVKTVVERSAGSNLRTLIGVHERILDKQRYRLSDERYELLRAAMYDQFVVLAASAGDLRLAGGTAVRLARERRSVGPLMHCTFWSLRGALLRALPRGTRHRMRLIRSRLRRAWTR